MEGVTLILSRDHDQTAEVLAIGQTSIHLQELNDPGLFERLGHALATGRLEDDLAATAEESTAEQGKHAETELTTIHGNLQRKHPVERGVVREKTESKA